MNTFNYEELINELMSKGISFLPGLTDEDIDTIENTYSIEFPKSLQKFYKLGVPTMETEYGNSFPQWMDFSQNNIIRIQKLLNEPIKGILHAIIEGFWVSKWGEKSKSFSETAISVLNRIENAPKLIPVFLHRYIIQIPDSDDPPVISVVGNDIICYGCNLREYFCNEFINNRLQYKMCSDVPFWSDIINIS